MSQQPTQSSESFSSLGFLGAALSNSSLADVDMASKKVIAICQSGGYFVKDNDGSLSYSGGEAFAVDIDEETQLSDFRAEVAEMFGFEADSITVKYFLPGNRRTLITVSKDKDLHRMVSYVKDADTVDVFVITKGQPARNMSTMPCSRSSRTASDSEAVTPPFTVTSFENNAGEPIDINVVEGVPLNSIPPILAKNMYQEAYMKMLEQHQEDTITGVGQKFASFAEFREALHKYSLANSFSYKYKKNDLRRVTVKCRIDSCQFRIYASKLATTQLVCIRRMVGEHTCEGAVALAGYRATRSWVGDIIKEKLKSSPNCKPKDIVDDIKKEFGIELNYSQAWRAKESAREQLQGSYKEAYSQLPTVCWRIRETNPGSVANFTTKEDSSFHRLFISFRASINGFKQGCRPLLFLDSAPLNSKYQGDLLGAMAADGGDGVFPLAFAIVDTETESDWLWFLQELKNTISMDRPITFIADFRKGLKESLPSVFSNCFHGYCLKHLAEKLNVDLKGQLSHEARRMMLNDLYAAAYAPRLEEFQRCVDNIKAMSPEAYNWVVQSEPRQWANAFFEGARYNLMISSFGQQFYDWVSEVSDLPITQVIDTLRGKMMELFYTRKMESNQWLTALTPSKEELLQSEGQRAQSLQVLSSHENIFSVQGVGSLPFTVDLGNCICSCKEWQLSGLPCCHALAVFGCIGKSPYDFCSSYFTVDFYRLTYAEPINPIPNVDNEARLIESDQAMRLVENDPVPVKVTPPSNKRPPGRPKLKSVELLDSLKRQLQCSKCKGLGHNKKTCKEP